MKTFIHFTFLLLLAGCVAKPRLGDQTQTPAAEIEIVSKNLDSPPEPVGGLEAIQAVLRAPEEVALKNKEGRVMVEATINTSGRVIATKIAASSGFEGMDAEALLAVARVAWKPARKGGTPVTAVVHVPVVFEQN